MEIPLEELKNFRRYKLHQYPEVSGEEKETAERIKYFLRNYPPDEVLEGLGGYGLAAVYKGKEAGPGVLLRCELDALPIEEINSFEYRSQNPGKGHQCGHDGHMAIMLGVATSLSEQRPAKGKVILLFQPAEENGEGARGVMKDERFVKIKPDFVFALHNLPGYPFNEVVLKKGSFTAAVNSMVVKLIGKTSHAGEPDKGINPALAVAEIIQQVDKLNNLDFYSENYSQISYVHMSMGEKAYGVSAGEAEIGFTFRCWTTDKRDVLGERMRLIAEDIGVKHKLKVEISFTESFHANQNADEAIEVVEEVAKEADLSVTYQPLPHRFGEDFGLFTDKFTGALFGLGAGVNTPALHNPDYDFPDKITLTGINVFNGIIDKLNK
ncbi:MAG: amidohydrolase [Candidatus Cyclobacteriaceae bacterium M2_1C_046]